VSNSNKNKRRDKFKNATAATLRALAHKSQVDVTFTDTNTYAFDRVAPYGTVRLPTPDEDLTSNSISLTRGAADAHALRLQHHNEDLHARLAPKDYSAKTVFDALERARVEALGAKQMKGVAQNLHDTLVTASNRARYDLRSEREEYSAVEAIHLMARLALTGEKPPESAKALIDAWRPWLDEKLGPNGFDTLKENLASQNDFGLEARNVMKALDLGWADESNSDDDNSADDGEAQEGDGVAEHDNDIGDQESEEEQQAPTDDSDEEVSDSDDSEYDSSSDEHFSEEEAASENESEQAGATRQRKSNSYQDVIGENYKIYTQAFDVVSKAEDLAETEELDRLRDLLDHQLVPLQGVITKLANRLQRKLMAKQQRSWIFDQEEGILDTARLPRIVANPTVPLSYKIERQNEFRDTVVTLLIDNSGSMRGRPIATAAICTDILARTLERCGVKVEILGFTTRAWKGGKSRELWLANGRESFPGRLNDLSHIIYKSADAPWRRARRNLGLMLKEGILKENIDGEALVWAHNRLASRGEQRKILIIISDGAPVDDSTLSVNPSTYLEDDLRNVIKWIDTLGQVELSAIGIGHDVTRYYRKALTISDVDQLAQALVNRMTELFDSAE
jgi:cobaltochelatase CobT